MLCDHNYNELVDLVSHQRLDLECFDCHSIAPLYLSLVWLTCPLMWPYSIVSHPKRAAALEQTRELPSCHQKLSPKFRKVYELLVRNISIICQLDTFLPSSFAWMDLKCSLSCHPQVATLLLLFHLSETDTTSATSSSSACSCNLLCREICLSLFQSSIYPSCIPLADDYSWLRTTAEAAGRQNE